MCVAWGLLCECVWFVCFVVRCVVLVWAWRLMYVCAVCDVLCDVVWCVLVCFVCVCCVCACCVVYGAMVYGMCLCLFVCVGVYFVCVLCVCSCMARCSRWRAIARVGCNALVCVYACFLV